MRSDYGQINGWRSVPNQPDREEVDQEEEENEASDRGEALYKEELDGETLTPQGED